MALPSIKTSFTFNHADQQDNLGQAFSGDFNQVQTAMDSRSEEMRVLVNQLIYALDSATDGASGADNIKATAIADVTGNTVQAILENLKVQLDTVVAGGVPDGSVTADKLDSGIIGTKTYTEDNYIADNEAVATSLNKLDMAVKDRQDNIDVLTAEVGTTTYTEKNFIADSDPLATSIDKLDMKLKDVSDLEKRKKVLYAYRSANAGAGNQAITLGYRPRYVKITARLELVSGASGAGGYHSNGAYDGTDVVCVFTIDSDTQSYKSQTEIIKLLSGASHNTATITFSDTGFTLAWTQSGSIAAGTINMLCEIE